MQKFVGTSIIRRHIATTALAALALSTSVACSNEETPLEAFRTAGASVTLSPKATTDIAVGGTKQLSFVARDKDGNVENVAVTWSTSDPAVVTVSTSGLVTAVGPGSGSVIATTAAGVKGTSTFIVKAVTQPAVVAFDNVAPIMSVGTTRQIFATATDANGRGVPITSLTFSSSAPTLVSVNNAGVLTALAPGNVTITATVNGKAATTNVQAAFLAATVTLAPSPLVVAPGATGQITPTVRDIAGGLITGRTLDWTSNNTGAATVGATTGLVSVPLGAFGSAIITGSTTDPGGTVTGNLLVNPLVTGASQAGVAGRGGQGVAANTDFYKYYIDVPTGKTSMVVTLQGGTGDADLYVDNPAGTQVCASENGTAVNETCTITNPTAGRWRVRVEGWTNFTTWTLRAVVTP